MSLAFVWVSHKLTLTSLESRLGHSLSICSLYASLCPLAYLVHLPKVGVVCRRGEYKPWIYSERGQCPASRGKDKTVFFSPDFLREGATFSSQ